jgi:hypothetical protein
LSGIAREVETGQVPSLNPKKLRRHVEKSPPAPTRSWKRPSGRGQPTGAIAMKYMLMMQFPLSEWRTSRIELWPPQDVRSHMDYLQQLNRELVDAGEFVDT